MTRSPETTRATNAGNPPDPDRVPANPSNPWSGADLLGMRGVAADRLRGLLTRARARRDRPTPSLAGRTVATAFFEDSTRTRSSFAIAAQRCGAHVVDLSSKASSANKGESLADTARVIEAMGVAAIVVRTARAGGAKIAADAVACPVINAGDGAHEHPTQALADALALDDAWKLGGSFDFSGKRVVIVGDLSHSRVARSNAASLTTLGAEVVFAGPPAMAPISLGGALGVRVSHDLDDELAEADAVMALRIQLERGAGAMLASSRDYRAAFGVTRDRADAMKPGALVMHPGPMNRGVEMDPDVADGPRSIVLRQVAAGVAVREAALEAVIGPGSP
ncbi:MAG: aspartate carbamoyltransferase catalytic subunit [Phycisphaerales bacterium]